MRTNGVPSLVMLSAGFVDCIIGVSRHMDVVAFMRQLAFVLLIFYIIGVIVKLILDKSMKAFADPPQEEKKNDSATVSEESAKVEEKK